jgi:hypothetical protein
MFELSLSFYIFQLFMDKYIFGPTSYQIENKIRKYNKYYIENKSEKNNIPENKE